MPVGRPDTRPYIIAMQIFTVSAIAGYIKALTDTDGTLRDLWLRGEVSNLTQSQAGHCYFTLKDGAAQISCVLFRGSGVGLRPANGQAVIIHGRVSFYETRGQLQCYVDLVQPEGMGSLQLQFELLKSRLEGDGLFDVSRKRPLPRYPRGIGVVTSPTGAVWHDILRVLGRRYPLATVVLAPTTVQGDGAALSIAQAIQLLNSRKGIDVIIVARGGGSTEELWAFNEEPVARAIFASRVPIVTGIGHETDFTIADLVADLRAPTPSVAAELVAPDRTDLIRTVQGYQERIYQTEWNSLATLQRELDLAQQRLQPLAPDLAALHMGLAATRQRMTSLLASMIALRWEQLRGRRQALEGLDPAAVLARGYALVQRQDTGEIVRRASQVEPYARLRVRVHDGAFNADVVP